MLDRHIHIDFQASRLVDRRQLRRGRDAVAHVHRNISHNPAAQRDHFVIMQLHFLLVYLRVERIHLRLGRVQGRLRLVQILLAHHPRGGKSLRALILLLRPDQVRLLRRPRTLLALHRGLLLQRIDLDQRSCPLPPDRPSAQKSA